MLRIACNLSKLKNRTPSTHQAPLHNLNFPGNAIFETQILKNFSPQPIPPSPPESLVGLCCWRLALKVRTPKFFETR